jgi:hypothetical protein
LKIITINNTKNHSENEEILFRKPANLFRGIEAVGGTLKLSTSKLIFEPHAINFQRQNLEIPYHHITLVKPRNTLGVVPNGILIELHSGEHFKFVVNKRSQLIQFIQNKIS